MIPKVNSSQMNTMLDSAIAGVENIKSDLDRIDANMQKKFLVMKNEQDFALERMGNIKILLTNANVLDHSNKIVFGTGVEGGQYDSYGCCIHPKFSSTPTNMFNFITADGAYFKNNMVVKVNDIISLPAKECLKHDSVQTKDIYFEEYDSDDLTFSITVDTGKLVGDTKCNMIEIAPFIAGSFEITNVAILSKESKITGGTIPVSVVKNLGEIGNTRIMLDSTYNIYQIDFTIKLLYKNAAGKYPFGLRHLYLYNASYAANSFVVANITKDKYVDNVSDDVILTTQNNRKTTSATDSEIQLYLTYTDGTLGTQLDISTHAITNSWPRETKKFFVKIPVTTTLYALQFLSVITR